MLTGEDIPYNKKGRRFHPRQAEERRQPRRPRARGRSRPAGRTSTSTACPPSTRPAPRRAGRLDDLTLGLNWYVVNNAKFQFNYIHPILGDARLGTSNADFFALRCQVDF